MFCNQCGGEIPHASRFCNHCGARVATHAGDVIDPVDETAWPAPPHPRHREPGYSPRRPHYADIDHQMSRDLSRAAEEETIFILRPTMIYVVAWYLLAALLVIAVAAVMGLLSGVVAGLTAFLTILGVALIAFAVPLYKHVLRRREVYTLTTHKLEMRYGLIAKTVRNIPLNKIQDVTVTASAGERLLGLGDIVIDSASESGKIFLEDIHRPERYADMVLAELRRRN
ncbi:MAG TPA: PH domain-containing protein [Blastocatellia bacterium]|nr:PH domain-containing protein [Blastocatellia bacterium]